MSDKDEWRSAQRPMKPLSERLDSLTNETKAETVIQKQTGIRPGASLLTPMDYGECIRCIECAIIDERPKAWNEAIDKAINVVRSYSYTGRICKELELLKHKQP